jgi:flagellar biogenesis protein FliO
MSLRPNPFPLPRSSWRPAARVLTVALMAFTCSVYAELTNAPAVAPALTPLPTPELGMSLVRVFGALFLVLAIFLGGVWMFRNWQRFATPSGRAPKLNVLEVRSLGGRQALYVVGYERERYLLSSSQTGVNLVTHLPLADESTTTTAEGAKPAIAFSQVLTQMLRGGK